jgi:hypothetical protein
MTMSDPRRNVISVGTLSIQPADALERWQVREGRDDGLAVEAAWGEWVRLARRILEADALSRDLEVRGDAWDEGHAAGRAGADDAVNPYR